MSDNLILINASQTLMFEITGHISCSDIISTEIAARAYCVAILRTGAMLMLATWNREGEVEAGVSNCLFGLTALAQVLETYIEVSSARGALQTRLASRTRNEGQYVTR